MKKENRQDFMDETSLPYERFLRFGAESLTEAELLAIIIRTGTPNKNALELAKEVLALASYPNRGLLGLQHITLEQLRSIEGIGEVKAIKLKCLTELSLRMSRAKTKDGARFVTPEQVAEYYMEQLRHRDTECVIVASVDSKGKLMKDRILSEGSVKMSLISPREIFLEALGARAVNIILVHNHPSGDPAPSQSDILLTDNVRRAGEMMDIPLLDHIIIGDNRYVSFRESNWFSTALHNGATND